MSRFCYPDTSALVTFPNADTEMGFTISGPTMNGTIPTEIGQLTALGACSIMADIIYSPVLLSNASVVADTEMLQMTNITVGGTFPSELGRLSNLSALRVVWMQFCIKNVAF